ncbi:MAG: hypothetical protein ACYSSI_00330 [Planctomycetota bacterium]|jgi:hypothetical protein
MGIKEFWELKQFAGDIAKIIAYIITIASIIVKLTPTLKDDTVLLKVIKIVSKYVALNRNTKDDIIRKVRK